MKLDRWHPKSLRNDNSLKHNFFFAHHFLHSSRFTTGNGSSSGASAGSAGSSFGAASGASPTGSGSAEGVGIGVAPSLVMPAVVRAIHCFTLHQMGWIMIHDGEKKVKIDGHLIVWFSLLAFRTRGTQYRIKTKQPQVPNIRWEIERDMESLWNLQNKCACDGHDSQETLTWGYFMVVISISHPSLWSKLLYWYIYIYIL